MPFRVPYARIGTIFTVGLRSPELELGFTSK